MELKRRRIGNHRPSRLINSDLARGMSAFQVLPKPGFLLDQLRKVEKTEEAAIRSRAFLPDAAAAQLAFTGDTKISRGFRQGEFRGRTQSGRQHEPVLIVQAVAL